MSIIVNYLLIFIFIINIWVLCITCFLIFKKKVWKMKNVTGQIYFDSIQNIRLV